MTTAIIIVALLGLVGACVSAWSRSRDPWFTGHPDARDFSDHRSEPTPVVPFGHVHDKGDRWEWVISGDEVMQLDSVMFHNYTSLMELAFITNGVKRPDGYYLRRTTTYYDPVDGSRHFVWPKDSVRLTSS